MQQPPVLSVKTMPLRRINQKDAYISQKHPHFPGAGVPTLASMGAQVRKSSLSSSIPYNPAPMPNAQVPVLPGMSGSLISGLGTAPFQGTFASSRCSYTQVHFVCSWRWVFVMRFLPLRSTREIFGILRTREVKTGFAVLHINVVWF